MDPVVVALVLASAVIHPLWNALLKGNRHPLAVFFVLNASMAAYAAVHALVTGADLMAAGAVWPLILLSTAGQMLYGINLLLTYRQGALSVYYPIIRSSPVFVVLVGVLFLDRHYRLTFLIGIGLTLVGAFMLQYRAGERVLSQPRVLLTAVLAMCGTGIYSLADARLMQSMPVPVVLFWIQLLAVPCYLLAYRAMVPPETTVLGHLRTGMREAGWRAAGAGALGYLSYWLILAAFARGGDVAAVTTIRQASIPMSVLIGGFALAEGEVVRKLLWSLLLAAGIVVVVRSA